MNIWLLQASEPMPVVNNDRRLLRTGMLAEELNKKNYNIIWFSNTFDHFSKKQQYDKDTIIRVNDNYLLYLFHGIKYKKNISISRIINHKTIAVKFRKMAKKLSKPDLIYVSFPTIDYAEVAVEYGKKNNVPVIVDIRDLWPDIFNHNLPKILRFLAVPYIKLMNHKTKKLLRDAYAINSISEAMLNWGLKKGNRTKTKNDRYFYIGYDKQDNKTVQKYDRMDLNKFNISFFATINNQYDYVKLVQLAKKLENEDISINICGDGPQFSELKEMTKNLSNIKLLGWTSKNDLAYILQNSKLGLAPYKNTFDFQMSVSNKFSEYLSYGLPVVMTVDGYMQELLQKNNCGISSQKIDELAKFIVKLKNNKDIYQKMAEKAKKLYEDNFVAKKIYKDLVEYLEEIKGEMKK